MTWLEDEAFTEMYERGGFMISADASLTLLAGSTLGGGMPQCILGVLVWWSNEFAGSTLWHES